MPILHFSFSRQPLFIHTVHPARHESLLFVPLYRCHFECPNLFDQLPEGVARPASQDGFRCHRSRWRRWHDTPAALFQINAERRPHRGLTGYPTRRIMRPAKTRAQPHKRRMIRHALHLLHQRSTLQVRRQIHRRHILHISAIVSQPSVSWFATPSCFLIPHP